MRVKQQPMRGGARTTMVLNQKTGIKSPITAGKSPAGKTVPAHLQGVQKKKHRWRPGTVALREIRKYQKSVDPAIPFAPFARLVKEIAHDYNTNMRFTHTSLMALREATEAFGVELMEDAQTVAIHAKRIGVTPKDIQLVMRLKRDQRADY